MPRKKNEGKPVDATGSEMKIVRLELTVEQHKRLRLAAARKELSMAALAREVMNEYLDKEEPL